MKNYRYNNKPMQATTSQMLAYDKTFKYGLIVELPNGCGWLIKKSTQVNTLEELISNTHYIDTQINECMWALYHSFYNGYMSREEYILEHRLGKLPMAKQCQKYNQYIEETKIKQDRYFEIRNTLKIIEF